MRMKLNLKAYSAEIIGTFLLSFAVIVSSNREFPLPTPVIAASALGLLVYLFGSISGTHINPAITIGLFIARKIDLGNTFVYLFSQMLGALLAMFVAQLFLGNQLVAPAANTSFAIFFAEAMGTMVLALGVGSVVFGKVHESASGIVIGTSLLLGILVAAAGSNGVLNPAVALGTGAVSSSYLFGPILGGIVGISLAKFLHR
jgi:aquaporin Z